MISLRTLLLLISTYQVGLMADPCRLETDEAVAQATKRFQGVKMLVTVCGHCQKNEPIPLRVTSIEFKHHAPDTVELIHYDLTFSVQELRNAEESGTGRLADALRGEIDREYLDETGYLPNDPFLIEEKRDRFSMLLGFAREDLEMRTLDELWINGQPSDPAQLYYPIGGDRYRNLGLEVDCDNFAGSPELVDYKPIDRDPKKEAPPDPFIADVTGQCYDGSCPTDEWTTVRDTPIYDEPEGDSIGHLSPGETVKPVKTLSYVTGAKVVATTDHDHIFKGDVFYLLDSLAEGFYRFWHYGRIYIDDASDIRIRGIQNYCEKRNNCWAVQEQRSIGIWWSRVERSDSTIVWIREPLDTMTGVLVD